MDTQPPDNQAEAPKRFRRNPSPLAQCIIASEGNVNAGILLHQILYRFRCDDTLTKRDGRKWIAQTRENWVEETALTMDRYKSAIEKLKKLKLIKVMYRKYYKRDKWPKTFIRPLVKPMQIGIGVKTLTGNGDKSATVNGANPTTDSGGNAATNKDNTEGKNKKEKVLPSAKNLASSLSKKETDEDEEDESDNLMNTIPSIKEIEELWCNYHLMYYPKLAVTPFAGSDFNSAKNLITKLQSKADIIVPVALGDWDGFVDFVENHGPYFNLGDIPDIHLLAKHAGLALHWWKEITAPPKKKSGGGKTVAEIMIEMENES